MARCFIACALPFSPTPSRIQIDMGEDLGVICIETRTAAFCGGKSQQSLIAPGRRMQIRLRPELCRTP